MVSTGYVACAASSAYSPSTVGFGAPAGYTASVASVRYWTGTAWTSTCSPDLGLQQVTLRVTAQQLSSWSGVAGKWLLGTGTRNVWVGSSSREPAQQTAVTVR